MLSLRQIGESYSMCWSRNEPSKSSNNPKRQFHRSGVQWTQGGTFLTRLGRPSDRRVSIH
jgi:hypothetical protein